MYGINGDGQKYVPNAGSGLAPARFGADTDFNDLCLGTLWGASSSLAKLAVLDGIQPLGYALWNSAGAGAIMLAICAWKGMLPRMKAEHVRYYAICGALGVAAPNLNVAFVVGHIPAGIVAVALSTTPIMIYAIALVWRLERFDVMRASGLILALVGTLFIILPKASLRPPVRRLGFLWHC
jgi:drug/metabolite transporter (DMT)-like permease